MTAGSLIDAAISRSRPAATHGTPATGSPGESPLVRGAATAPPRAEMLDETPSKRISPVSAGPQRAPQPGHVGLTPLRCCQWHYPGRESGVVRLPRWASARRCLRRSRSVPGRGGRSTGRERLRHRRRDADSHRPHPGRRAELLAKAQEARHEHSGHCEAGRHTAVILEGNAGADSRPGRGSRPRNHPSLPGPADPHPGRPRLPRCRRPTRILASATKGALSTKRLSRIVRAVHARLICANTG